VRNVKSGWKGFMEINTVHYDPAEITISEMEKILKKAGTYRKTMQGD
jgi:hypothetical protein